MWQVWVFLAPLCPICQDYTYYLNALHEQWSAAEEPQVELVGWFPNPTVTGEAIAEFADRYAVEWKWRATRSVGRRARGLRQKRPWSARTVRSFTAAA